MTTSLFARVVVAVRQQWLLVAAVLATGTIVASFAVLSTHAKFTATTTVLMVAESSETTHGLSSSPAATTPLLSTDIPTLATDTTVLIRLRDDLGETSSIEALRSHITAKVSQQSTIMPVQYTAANAETAIRGANLLSDEIVRFYREIATTRFDSLIADYNSQLSKRSSELTLLDGKIATAARSYPYIDISSPGTSAGGSDSVYGRLVAIRAERDTLRATMDADGAQAKATTRLIVDAAPLAQRDIVNSDTSYLSVRDQYVKDFAALAKVSAYGSGRYPGVVELRAIVARERGDVDVARRHAAAMGPRSNATYVAALDSQARADALFASDHAKLQTQDAELSRLNDQIGRGSIAIEVARLRRDRGNAESAYATIADRLAKAIANRSEAASTGSVIILDRARFAPKAASLGGREIGIGILFLTVWLALTLAVMVDGMQEWFRDAQSVELVYGSKLIGSIA